MEVNGSPGNLRSVQASNIVDECPHLARIIAEEARAHVMAPVAGVIEKLLVHSAHVLNDGWIVGDSKLQFAGHGDIGMRVQEPPKHVRPGPPLTHHECGPDREVGAQEEP